MRLLAAWFALAAAGCAPLRPDPNVACRIVRDAPLPAARTKDLYELSLGTPVEGQATSAWAQKVTATTMGAVGSVALLGGLIMGFGTDAATQLDVRNAGFGIVGGALGLFAGTLILSHTSRGSAERARLRLRLWADRCGP